MNRATLLFISVVMVLGWTLVGIGTSMWWPFCFAVGHLHGVFWYPYIRRRK